MARYESIAEDASKTINTLMDLIPDDKKEMAAPLIAFIYNYGIRTAPRGVQATVRYRAVKIACKDLPVTLAMEQRVNPTTKRTYNVLLVNRNTEVSDSDD